VCDRIVAMPRQSNRLPSPTPMGARYCGIVEEVAAQFTSISPAVRHRSFFASDNNCPNCQYGYQSSCQRAEFSAQRQASVCGCHSADGTLSSLPMCRRRIDPESSDGSDVMERLVRSADAAGRLKAGLDTVVVVA